MSRVSQLHSEHPYRQSLWRQLLGIVPENRFLATLAFLCAALPVLCGCSFFPHDGPSVGAVRDGATGTKGSYSLVELDPRAAEIIETMPAPDLVGLGRTSSSLPVDLIGVGDGLSVTVYEQGPATLFGGGPLGSSLGGGMLGGAGLSGALGLSALSSDRATQGSVPRLTVDTQGNITLPYAGYVHVAGLTTSQAGHAIDLALKGKTAGAQAVVNIVDNVANSVTVLGEVHSPGRYPLAPGSNRILDVLALASGPTQRPEDTRVVVMRGATSASVSLADLLRDDSQNIGLAPRDQIRLVYAPRKFSTFGALTQPTQYPIADESMTLAAALSRSGGLDPASANASSVLLFRFERPAVAQALAVNAPVSSKGVPIVYHLSLEDPEGLFVANRFEIQPDDLIYVPRASLSEAEQFIGIVNAISAVAYNVRVTTAVVP